MKFRKFLSFILAIFLSMLPANQSLVLADGSGEQEFTRDKGIFESLIGTSSDAQSEDEFFKPDKEDMFGETPIEYSVWVKDRWVTSANKDDVLGDGKVQYEPASAGKRAKLTLNDLNLSVDVGASGGSVYSFIYADEDIDINLKGKNVINISSTESYSESALYGVDADENLHFIGGGSLAININTEKPGDVTYPV